MGNAGFISSTAVPCFGYSHFGVRILNGIPKKRNCHGDCRFRVWGLGFGVPDLDQQGFMALQPSAETLLARTPGPNSQHLKPQNPKTPKPLNPRF